jgi:hypothetical protein
VAAVVRGILAQTSFEAACRFVTSIPHASGQSYLITGAGQNAMFECCASGVRHLNSTAAAPESQLRYLTQTNHSKSEPGPEPAPASWFSSSYTGLSEAKVQRATDNSRTRDDACAAFVASATKQLLEQPPPPGDQATALLCKVACGALSLNTNDQSGHPVNRLYRRKKPFFTFGAMVAVVCGGGSNGEGEVRQQHGEGVWFRLPTVQDSSFKALLQEAPGGASAGMVDICTGTFERYVF